MRVSATAYWLDAGRPPWHHVDALHHLQLLENGFNASIAGLGRDDNDNPPTRDGIQPHQ